jgi:hypothetical protein
MCCMGTSSTSNTGLGHKYLIHSEGMYAGRNSTKNCYKEIQKRWCSCITLLLLLVLPLILDTADETYNSTDLHDYSYLEPLSLLEDIHETSSYTV